MKKILLTVSSIIFLFSFTLCTNHKTKETTPADGSNVQTPPSRTNETYNEPPTDPKVSGPEKEPQKKKRSNYYK